MVCRGSFPLPWLLLEVLEWCFWMNPHQEWIRIPDAPSGTFCWNTALVHIPGTCPSKRIIHIPPLPNHTSSIFLYVVLFLYIYIIFIYNMYPYICLKSRILLFYVIFYLHNTECPFTACLIHFILLYVVRIFFGWTIFSLFYLFLFDIFRYFYFISIYMCNTIIYVYFMSIHPSIHPYAVYVY